MTRRAVPWFVAATLCFGATGCAGSAPPSASPIRPAPTTAPPIPPKSTGLVPAAASVSDRIVLTKHIVRAGTTIAGTLIVTNTSANPINLTQTCQPDYAVVIRNRVINQEPAFTTGCSSQPFCCTLGPLDSPYR